MKKIHDHCILSAKWNFMLSCRALTAVLHESGQGRKLTKNKVKKKTHYNFSFKLWCNADIISCKTRVNRRGESIAETKDSFLFQRKKTHHHKLKMYYLVWLKQCACKWKVIGWVWLTDNVFLIIQQKQA